MSSTPCSKCGTPAPAFASKFCLKCGTKFAGSAPSTPTKPASVPAPAVGQSPTTTTSQPSVMVTPPSTPTKSTPTTPTEQPSVSPRRDGCFCQGCKGIIVGDMVEDGKSLRYHPACFSCSQCSSGIRGTYTYDDKGKLVCDACTRKQMHLTGEDICSKCKQKIAGEAVFVVKSDRYHKSCFTCVGCGVSVEGISFALTDKGLMCRPCNLKAHGHVCSACHQLIDGSAVRALDKVWHEACFVCNGCKKNLYQTGQYFAEGDHAYCPDCATFPHSHSSSAPAASSSTPSHSAEPSAPTHSAPASKPKFCGECGHPASGGKFCSECGHPLG